MAIYAGTSGERRAIPWRVLGWGGAGLLLLLPWVADAPWTASDFVVAGAMLGSVGLAFELIVRKSNSLAYRLGAALAVIGALLTVWINGAVGMIGTEGNPYNLLFATVPLVALVGAIVARFKPSGMVLAMASAATVQVVLSLFGLWTDLRGGVFSMVVAAPWLLAAALFRSAARD